MLILSQNKMCIVNTETNSDIFIAYNGTDVRTDKCMLGEYEDVNECKEAIALIYQAYASGNRVFMMPQSEVIE